MSDDWRPGLEASIEFAQLKRILNDWRERRQGREFPSRADFPPESIKYLLGNVVLLDVTYDPLRFRYRLVGSTVAIRRQQQMTGKYMDQHPDPEFREVALGLMRHVVETRRPQRHRYNMLTKLGHFVNYEILNLPLSSNGTDIDMIMSGSAFPGEI